jgi:hypothetical protein
VHPEPDSSNHAPAGKRRRGFWRKFSRITWISLAVLALLLLAGRLALPGYVESYVNKKLASLPEYRGKIGHVEIHLWRGAYSIHDVDIVKKNGQSLVPFFSARVVDFSVEWRELFHGSVVSEIEVDRGSLNFVESPNEAQSQKGISKEWIKVVEDLVPFQINRFVFRNSEAWFHDVGSNPTIDVYITNVYVLATNITNTRDLSTNLPAYFHVFGTTLGNGLLDLEVHANPLATKPTFNLNGRIEHMDVTALNSFLQAKAKVDVKHGTFRVYSEVAARDGGYEGYVKPFFEDLKVIDLPEDAKHPLKLAWKTIVAGAVQLFKNHSKDRVATKIPISGTFEKTDVAVWESVVNLLRNAFVQAIAPTFDKTVRVEDPKLNDKGFEPAGAERKKEDREHGGNKKSD